MEVSCEGLIQLNRRLKVENEDKMTFFCLILLCLMKYEIVCELAMADDAELNINL